MRMQPQELTAHIVEMGAYKAALLDVSLIHFDRKFRELCESNACGNYGACWTCPPDAGDIDTLIARAKTYQKALVYQTVGQLEDCINRGAKGLLKEVELFDIYTGAPIPEGKKSVAFNLTLRSDDRSLTAAEADEDVKSILELLEKELGAVLR